MLTLTVCAGIFLPNGYFFPNAGDGHIKNARRICDTCPELAELANNTFEKEDDFLIQCGCAIVACYDGERCFKVAENNNFSAIIQLKQIYQKAGIAIWDYWQIHSEYLPAINKVCRLFIEQTSKKAEKTNITKNTDTK